MNEDDGEKARALRQRAQELHRSGRFSEAIPAFREALELDPGSWDSHVLLSDMLWRLGESAQAIEHCHRAIALAPDEAAPYQSLATALMQQGRQAEAEAAFEAALARNPGSAKAHSDLVFALNYRNDIDPRRLFAAHRAWDERHARPLAPAAARFDNDKDPKRRLRVGYVSRDFRTHPVSSFFMPLLRAHDRAAIEAFCYADNAQRDAVTRELEALADRWRPIAERSDEDVAALIRGDRVDILVDLAGHTGDNRLRVFARRPAPIQVTWLGYPTSTGLSAIDYRLSDAIVDPEGEDEIPSSEAVVRLPEGYHCYRPPDNAPEVGPLPAEAAGRITFGSFNHLPKLSDPAIALWARLLAELPDARLLLKNRCFADAGTRQRFAEKFAAAGIEAERLALKPWVGAHRDHLALYNRIDLALDSFPYNGTTTTCEALWMGVPVVTFCGDRHAGRVGASLLTRVGLEDLIAPDEAGYFTTALALARDPDRLSALRAGLRARMSASPLCDETGFARAVELAYRDMWRRWCGGAATS